MRVCVVGCGSLGGIIAAKLSRSPAHEVWAIDKNPEILRVARMQGFAVRWRAKTEYYRVRLLEKPEELPCPADCIILATKTVDLPESAAAMRPCLADAGCYVTIQNGLAGLQLAESIGKELVVPASVLWGASMTGPGMYTITAKGGFLVGAIGDPRSPKATRVCETLADAFPASQVANIEGVQWAKLLITATLTSFGAITGLGFGAMLGRRAIRELFLEVGAEGLKVARTRGIELEPLGKLLRVDLLMQQHGMPLWTKHLLMRFMGMKHAHTESSMLASLRQGTRTEVDDINGVIVKLGAEMGVDTPLNSRIVEVVRNLEAGTLKPGLENLARFRRAPEDAPDA